ncbi:MAG: hypothetical protein ACE5HC_11515 [Candidatus Binatia bacterium]
MRQAPDGAVNRDQIPVCDPCAMARKIKEVAKFLSADGVGKKDPYPISSRK